MPRRLICFLSIKLQQLTPFTTKWYNCHMGSLCCCFSGDTAENIPGYISDSDSGVENDGRAYLYQQAAMPVTVNGEKKQRKSKVIQSPALSNSYKRSSKKDSRSPITDTELRDLISRSNENKFDDERLELIVSSIADAERIITCKQCLELIPVITFSSLQLKLISLLLPHISDLHENRQTLISSIQFYKDKLLLKELINKHLSSAL
jgi:hypothetical protein